MALRFLAVCQILTTLCHGIAVAQPAKEPKLSLLLVDGMNNHDWPRATKILKEILDGSGLFTVDVSTSPPGDAPKEAWDQWRPNFSKYDVVLSNFNGGQTPKGLHWPSEVEKALEDYVSSGGGLIIYHSANNSFPNWPAYNEMIGLGWRDKNFGPSPIVSPDEKVVEIPTGEGRNPGHGPEHDFQVTVLEPDHPISKGLPKKWMHPHEQLTHGQHGPAKNMTVLTYAYSKDTNENEVMDWVIPYGKGRVYTTMLGHLWKEGPDTAMRCVGFQTMLIRGCQWAATGKATYPVPKDFPTATEVRLNDQTQPATAAPPTKQGTPAAKDEVRQLAVKVDPIAASQWSAKPGVKVVSDQKGLVKSFGEVIAKQIAGQIDFAKEDLVHVSWGSSGPPFGTLRSEIKEGKGGRGITFYVEEPKVAVRGQAFRLGNDFFAVPKESQVRFGGSR
jgi:type 1 glutamine amidotransferase